MIADDYAHHPTEIAATIQAASKLGYAHVHVLFQPHRYSRVGLFTEVLRDEFGSAFDCADTVTFMDVYSAGVSAKSIHGRLPVKAVGAAVCVVGVVLALLCDTSSFESFLYWIGSVFVPMITVQLMDTLVLRQPRQDKRAFSVNNLLLWAVGFVLYRLFLQLNLPCGSTIPDMAATALLCLLVGLVERARKSRKSRKKSRI